MEILDFLKNKDVDTDDLISMLFADYQQRKKEDTLYSKDDYIPQNLIQIYFQTADHLPFDEIVENFKKKYIYNENKLENVHEKEEQAGLGEVYDFVRSDKYTNCNNPFIILIIHKLLYSKCPYPEFGGAFRNNQAMIEGSDVKTSDPTHISGDVGQLMPQYNELLKMAEEINNNKQELIIPYIDKVLEMKCRLVEIHPFGDGNGRTMRALVNMMFKMINLPPIYVEAKEKKEYIQAMDQAIREKDTSSIKKFYYYKICDSIVELDINKRAKGISTRH